jgi:tetratricopeptide (TPR) repeat protein
MSASTAAQRGAAWAEASKSVIKYRADDWSGALGLYHSALRRAPDHSDASVWHFHCGYCLTSLNRTAEAVEAYTKCIELNSKDSNAYTNRGNCRKEWQKWELAALHCSGLRPILCGLRRERN